MKNIDKYLKDFLFRVGSGVAQVAKEKTAPIRTGNLKRGIRVFEANASEVKIGNTLKIKYAHHKTQKEKGFILGRAPGKKSKSPRPKSKSISVKRLEYLQKRRLETR